MPRRADAWVDRRAAMRAAYAKIQRVHLSDTWAMDPAAREEARRWYEDWRERLRACRGLGVIDPGPQNPRW